MLYSLCCIIAKVMLWLRYRVTVTGLKETAAKGRRGILFLPNHPALIDPMIVSSVLGFKFRPRPLADEKQVRGTVLRYFKNIIRVLELPDLGVKGAEARDIVLRQIGVCAQALKDGDNILLYPAGHLYTSRYERLNANSGVQQILKLNPDVRIVLVRTTGLWGSSFGRGKGYQPSFGEALSSHFKHLLANLLIFSPRRRVTVEMIDAPDDFPRTADRDTLNRYLENFYNATSTPNTYVPYLWWEKGGIRQLPEPEILNTSTDTSEVPADVRDKVLAKLREMTSRNDIAEDNLLGLHLGMDSLMVSELQVWIQDEFGQPVNNPETLRTVGAVMLAAIGRSSHVQPLREIPDSFFIPADPTILFVPPGDKITDIFLQHAAARPDFPIIADQLKGVVTHRQMILAILVLKSVIEKLPGERLGFIMPACLTANIVYLAMLFAGKVPAMINWTVGLRNMKHCLDNAEVTSVLTSRAVIDGLEGKGTDFGDLKERFLYLEDLVAKVSTFTKIRCLLASKFNWRSLRHAHVADLAAILFTSGSESLPKAVPITHVNIITNARSAADGFELRRDDVVIGMLPPFHSFGLLINFIMPDCAQLRVAYHTNPTEGDMIARLISAYKATMIVGTPTFAHNILRNAEPDAVASIRLIITGAEKCPQQTFDLLHRKCPKASLNEGYGITECSPIVAVNKPHAMRDGSLGKVMPCMEWTIRDENLKPVPNGETGMLYVRGDNVVSGYLNFDGPSPFADIDGKQFYRTGDLVAADDDGYIFFKGRKKRFVKIAGEMVSLPAIEDVLMKAYRTPDGDLPLAVEAVGSEEQPVVTLFTILDLSRETVNQVIREAGLSPIHNIKNIVKLDAIPVLGTGKTDYRSLKQLGAAH